MRGDSSASSIPAQALCRNIGNTLRLRRWHVGARPKLPFRNLLQQIIRIAIGKRIPRLGIFPFALRGIVGRLLRRLIFLA